FTPSPAANAPARKGPGYPFAYPPGAKRREMRLLLARLQSLHARGVSNRIADRELVAHLLQLAILVEVEEEHLLDRVHRAAVLVLDGADDLVRLDVDDAAVADDRGLRVRAQRDPA